MRCGTMQSCLRRIIQETSKVRLCFLVHALVQSRGVTLPLTCLRTTLRHTQRRQSWPSFSCMSPITSVTLASVHLQLSR